jgi:hypothetical protein
MGRTQKTAELVMKPVSAHARGRNASSREMHPELHESEKCTRISHRGVSDLMRQRLLAEKTPWAPSIGPEENGKEANQKGIPVHAGASSKHGAFD